MNIEAPAHGCCYEEEFLGFEIVIEHNADRWRDGFVWSIFKDSEEIDTGLEFRFNEAKSAAKTIVHEFIVG